MAHRLRQIFARRVRQEMDAKNLSVNRLADFAGLARGFVSEVLRAEKAPTLDTVDKLATALEIDAWRLLAEPVQYGTVRAASLLAADVHPPKKSKRS